ncbi:cellulose-binding protein [Streptomyces sp. Ru71]|uniref:cellulase family glycosylhydrolase n=1 Tax=Streptomyces sp. Ru71 TaxID=2080746 RepID=UPI000CDD386E|nr:cellulase family glycosylhydrolase [Streptomyces sp. Ru71]POX46162.1 cellulose-binding protein [Streptomyces sp. Ru71]
MALVTTAVVPVVTAQAAAPACTVEYSVTGQWDTGFQGAVKITNNTAALSGWRLTFDFPGTQKVTQGWNAQWSQSGTTVTAANESWNGSLATGASVSAGFLGTWSGSNAVPTAFKLNGTACNVDTEPTPDPTDPDPTDPPGNGTAPALHVQGAKLVDADGRARRLLGVNRSGGEFMCVQGYGIWDGPVDDAAIKAIADWKANAVRIPLNEECWLGLSDVKPEYAGANYIGAVKELVDRVKAHGMTPIVELHWTYGQYTGNSAGCSDVHATCQKPMPDAQYTPSFWSSVASTFKNDPAVVFDLFNEPYPDRATSTTAQAWQCWRDGGSCPGIGYEVAGMQDLVDAVRATGAKNVIMLGGLAYSNDLSQWLTYKPTDPAGNLAAAYHVYNFNTCAGESCWDSTLAPVAAQVPLVAGEIGENTCGHSFADRVMKWFDDRGLSYLGWTWNTWDCSSGPSLISAYDGTPTAYGIGLRDHLRGLNP